MAPAPKKRVGRPPEPVPVEKAAAIINGLDAGRTLTSIVAEIGIDYSTVTLWKQKDEKFAQEFARARVAGAAIMVEEGQDILDHATKETALLAKFRAEYRLKRAACFAPHVFGSKVQVDSTSKVEHSGAVTVSHQQLNESARKEWLHRLSVMARDELAGDDPSRN